MYTYPPELKLKRTSVSERNLSYLDISISICGGKYETEVYDKRDDFNFDIDYNILHTKIIMVLPSIAYNFYYYQYKMN